MVDFLRTDTFLYIILAVNAILLILYIIASVNSSKTKKEYKLFMKKLGNGNNIEEILKSQLKKIEEVDSRTIELSAYCKRLDTEIEKCVQKVGIVRYSAFKDVGSDLSFALALLDENNDGVVLNGIYSSEASNIYAKPVSKGDSKYKITVEEKQAIDMAIASNGEVKVIE